MCLLSGAQVNCGCLSDSPLCGRVPLTSGLGGSQTAANAHPEGWIPKIKYFAEGMGVRNFSQFHSGQTLQEQWNMIVDITHVQEQYTRTLERGTLADPHAGKISHSIKPLVSGHFSKLVKTIPSRFASPRPKCVVFGMHAPPAMWEYFLSLLRQNPEGLQWGGTRGLRE